MTNEQKFNTAEERVKAFRNFCKRDCKNCVLLHSGGGEFESVNNCWAYWLALPVEEEKPEPCPFCGSSVELRWHNEQDCLVCHNGHCGYVSGKKQTEADAIAAHNRVYRAVEAAKKGESK